MEIQQMPKIVRRGSKRLGRGIGSGKAKTSGRGQKGQKARGKIKLRYEGGQLPLLKRLPLLRGKGKNKPNSPKSLVINLKYLNILPDNTIVDREALVKNKLIAIDLPIHWPLKILGNGEVTKKFTIRLAISKSAAKKIEKAGGKIEEALSLKKSPKKITKQKDS